MKHLDSGLGVMMESWKDPGCGPMELQVLLHHQHCIILFYLHNSFYKLQYIDFSVVFTDWQQGQPNNVNDNQDCMVWH